jgi:hypothetical protein
VACALLAPALLLAGGPKVHHDPEVDFAAFATYGWPEGKGLEAARPEVQRAVVRAVDQQLQEKGLRKVDADEADLHVVTYVVSELLAGSTGDFYRNPDWAWGFISVDARMVAHGALVVDLYDAGGERLVWHMVAEATVADQQKAIRKIDAVVNKAFRRYPPASGDGKRR